MGNVSGRVPGALNTFRRSEVLRALRTTQEAGLQIRGWKFDRRDRSVTVLVGEPEPAAPSENPWDTVLAPDAKNGKSVTPVEVESPDAKNQERPA